MTIRTRIEGAAELDRVLKRLPKAIGERVLANAVRAGAKIIRDEARAKAPVRVGGNLIRLGKRSSKGRLPGFLRSQIITAKARKGTSSDSVTIHVGPSTKAFYGLFQEFGTRNHPAKPFLRPAFDGNVEKAIKGIGVKLGKDIEKAAVKLAGPLARSGLVKRRRR